MARTREERNETDIHIFTASQSGATASAYRMSGDALARYRLEVTRGDISYIGWYGSLKTLLESVWSIAELNLG